MTQFWIRLLMQLKATSLLLLTSLLLSGCGTLHSLRVNNTHTPPGEFVLIYDHTVHFQRRGKGIPVVLLHGNHGSSFDWMHSRVTQQDLGRYQFIAVDRPGYGYSRRGHSNPMSLAEHAAVLRSFIDKMELENVVVGGHSSGASVVLQYAIDNPNHAKGLLLVAPPLYPWPGNKVMPFERIATTPVLGRLFLETLVVPGGLLAKYGVIGRAFDGVDVADSYKDLSFDLALRPSQFRATSKDTTLLWDNLDSASQQYHTLGPNMIIVAGGEDPVVAHARNARRFKQEHAAAKVITLAEAGHQPHHSHPDAIVEALQKLTS